MITKVKTPKEISAMRESGRMLAVVLELLQRSINPGMTSKDLANLAAKELKSLGGEPAFLGYQGFTDVLCVSINDEVVHGIPGPKRVLKDGDVVGLDFGVRYRGMITDAAVTVILGKQPDNRVRELVEATRESLVAGIAAAHGGCQIGDIATAVQAVLDEHKLGIVRDLVGHGVGHDLHEEPNIPNHGRRRSGMVLETNMTIAIEPMATLGDFRVYIAPDGWTVRTRDGSLSAHFEHTILLTGTGAEILTAI